MQQLINLSKHYSDQIHQNVSMRILFILVLACVSCSYLGSAQGLSVVFKEEFLNNDRNWHVEYIGSRSSFLENETYIQEGYNNNVVCYTTQLIPLDPSKDFKLSVETKHLAGKMDKGYGFSF